MAKKDSSNNATAAQPPKPEVKTIPATIPITSGAEATLFTKRRTAGYARVSSDTDEQLNSYGAQVDYYTNYIHSRADWEFVSVYTDEGISGLNTKRRKGFNEMIEDALAGKIDLIVTKSVSRFARNTVDTLTTIRKLKENKIECYFEKENIWTFDGKGELLITIMSSLAQEESRSLSQNVTWGKRKGMADGTIALPWSRVFGYEKGDDDLPKIVPAQAERVREMYALFMQGKSYAYIAKHLTTCGVPTPTGKKKWVLQTVISILQNELYRGSIKRQKTFTLDFLTKKSKKNEGELPSFWIEKSHEPIIPPDEWDAVQAEIARRSELGRPTSCQSPFATKIQCGECGGWFGSKVWNSTDVKYRRVIWRCNERYRESKRKDFTPENGKRKCLTPHLKEQDIKDKFVAAFNQLTANRDDLIADCRIALDVLGDTADIAAEIAALEAEIEETSELLSAAIEENKRTAIDQRKWEKRNGAYLKRHAAATERLKALDRQKTERMWRLKAVELFIGGLEKQAAVIAEWDEGLWAMVVERVVVAVDGTFAFRFKNGMEIKV